MQPSEFFRHVEEDPLAPVYLFTGEADVLMEDAWRALVNKIVPEKARRFNGERWHAKEHTAAQVLERLSTITMFGSKQLLMVKNVEVWPKDQRNLLLSYLASPRPTSCLVATASQKKGLEKIEPAVAAIGKVIHFPALTDKEAPRWIQERVRRHRKQLTGPAASLLIEQAGLDSHRLERELEKLAAFVGEREKIGPEDVRQVVSSQRVFSVFELLDCVRLGQSGKAVATLRNIIAAGEAPLSILALLARQIRMVWQVKDAMERGIPSGQISQRLNLHSFTFKKYTQQAPSFSHDELYRIHNALREADVSMKSTGISPESTLESLIVGLCLRKRKNP